MSTCAYRLLHNVLQADDEAQLAVHHLLVRLAFRQQQQRLGGEIREGSERDQRGIRSIQKRKATGTDLHGRRHHLAVAVVKEQHQARQAALVLQRSGRGQAWWRGRERREKNESLDGRKNGKNRGKIGEVHSSRERHGVVSE